MTPDVTEICRLHAAYGYAIDRRDGDLLAALFAPDGSMVMPGFDPVVGREALAAHIQSAPPGVHLTAFPHLREDGIAVTAYVFTSAKFGRVVSGYYYDEFVREDAGPLLFARREISMPVTWQPPRSGDDKR
jgi:SnoaL-like protein